MTEAENHTLKLLREIRSDLQEMNARLSAIEKGQDRFRVRMAIMDTRQNDLAGDLAAIARIVERAKSFENGKEK